MVVKEQSLVLMFFDRDHGAMKKTTTTQHRTGHTSFSRLGRAVRHQWQEQQHLQERLLEINQPWAR